MGESGSNGSVTRAFSGTTQGSLKLAKPEVPLRNLSRKLGAR